MPLRRYIAAKQMAYYPNAAPVFPRNTEYLVDSIIFIEQRKHDPRIARLKQSFERIEQEAIQNVVNELGSNISRTTLAVRAITGVGYQWDITDSVPKDAESLDKFIMILVGTDAQRVKDHLTEEYIECVHQLYMLGIELTLIFNPGLRLARSQEIGNWEEYNRCLKRRLTLARDRICQRLESNLANMNFDLESNNVWNGFVELPVPFMEYALESFLRENMIETPTDFVCPSSKQCLKNLFSRLFEEITPKYLRVAVHSAQRLNDVVDFLEKIRVFDRHFRPNFFNRALSTILSTPTPSPDTMSPSTDVTDDVDGDSEWDERDSSQSPPPTMGGGYREEVELKDDPVAVMSAAG